MTTNEYLDCLLEVKRETQEPKAIDESAAYEAAQLVSGRFCPAAHILRNERNRYTCANLISSDH